MLIPADLNKSEERWVPIGQESQAPRFLNEWRGTQKATAPTLSRQGCRNAITQNQQGMQIMAAGG
jgi:hypothetical protein